MLSQQSVPSFDAQHTQEHYVGEEGFNLHAEERYYITRPALVSKRLKLNGTGDVVLRLKNPYQEGTARLVILPLEFIQRLVHL